MAFFNFNRVLNIILFNSTVLNTRTGQVQHIRTLTTNSSLRIPNHRNPAATTPSKTTPMFQ